MPFGIHRFEYQRAVVDSSPQMSRLSNRHRKARAVFLYDLVAKRVGMRLASGLTVLGQRGHTDVRTLRSVLRSQFFRSHLVSGRMNGFLKNMKTEGCATR